MSIIKKKSQKNFCANSNSQMEEQTDDETLSERTLSDGEFEPDQSENLGFEEEGWESIGPEESVSQVSRVTTDISDIGKRCLVIFEVTHQVTTFVRNAPIGIKLQLV